MGVRPGKRDLRIDFFRGLALVVIYVDHIPFDGLSRYTPKNFGFSSAADIFVLLAGVSFAFAYAPKFFDGRRAMAVKAIARRVAVIYTAHICVIALALLLLVVVGKVDNLDFYLGGPAPSWSGLSIPAVLPGAITLYFQPAYFDILPLYVVLLLFGLLLLVMARVHWSATLAVSACLALCAEIFHWNFPSLRSDAGWFFNPFTWQAVFVTGFCIGMLRLNGVRLERRPWIAAMCVAYIVLALIIVTPCRVNLLAGYCRFGGVGSFQMLSDPQTPWRLVNTLAWVYLVLYFVPRDTEWLKSAAARSAILMGRNSLPVFCAGTLLSLAPRLLIADSLAGSLTIQLGLNLLGPALLVLAAWLSDKGEPSDGVWMPQRANSPR